MSFLKIVLIERSRMFEEKDVLSAEEMILRIYFFLNSRSITKLYFYTLKMKLKVQGKAWRMIIKIHVLRTVGIQVWIIYTSFV